MKKYTLSEMVKATRKKRNLQQEEFVEIIGVNKSQNNYSK